MLQGMKKSRIIGFDSGCVTIHVFHVGFDIFEGMSKHGVLRLKVVYLTIEVVVFDLEEPLHFLPRCTDTARYEAFDDLLDAVAVL